MDVEKSSLCNCVVNFLLEENYLLSAFELLHELLDDGRDDQAIRLKEFFADPVQFPPDQISRFNSLRVADPQSLLEEKEALAEKLAIRDYENRLAQEDILKLKTELQKKCEARTDEPSDANAKDGADVQQSRETTFSDLGPLKAKERQDLNCAVKEYLLLAGYRLTAMTFYEEVSDQNLDEWQNSFASVPDALRHYYYQYLSSTTEAAEEKFSMLKKNESLLKENDKLKHEKQSLLRSRDLADAQAVALKKSLESLQRDIKEKENLVQDLKQSLEQRKKELNGCKAEISSLKMHMERARPTEDTASGGVEEGQAPSLESYKEEIESLQKEIERLNAIKSTDAEPVGSINSVEDITDRKDEVIKLCENDMVPLLSGSPSGNLESVGSENVTIQNIDSIADKHEEFSKSDDNYVTDVAENSPKENVVPVVTDNGSLPESTSPVVEHFSEKGPGTIQILSDALPKIVPYVLINHREELLPLMMCAIERHPDSHTRDSLTHTLFNLIKRPDEKQRRIIMDACVTLAKNVGEMRTETELLPQCWEQISHMYEERRLLVAQSCGELAEFVRPEIRDSLILSIVQQLVEDSAPVVREAAAHNLALLLPLFPNMDKYFKVEEVMFQLVSDPSGVVVETTIKELVPALLKWGKKLDHLLQVLLSHILTSIERCPPLSGVEGSVESHFRILGERERWTVDVLMRVLLELLPIVHQISIETCPYPSVSDSEGSSFSMPLLEKYAEGNVDWPIFEWLRDDCFSSLIQIVSLLPTKEDGLRNRISSFLLAVSGRFGDDYLTHVMLPIFLVAVGDSAGLACFPPTAQSKVQGLRPKTTVAERIATLCVLPILLAGVLGAPSKQELLTEYLRNLLVQSAAQEGQSAMHSADIYNAVRFLCMFEEHQNMVFRILWEMVVSSDMDLKINAAKLLKVIVPFIDAKVASTHVLPALVTLGSETNLHVLYASIDAFGTVAQNFKNDVIVDKIRVQMDAFLEDGSHEAMIAVIRALVVAVPHTTESLRDYLLSKIFHLSTTPLPTSNMVHRRERSNAFCEAIRALDATDISAASVRDLLMPTIQNLLKDTDALDPAHKEALEIIVKERSGGAFDTFSKVMGSQFGLPSSMTSFFSEGGLLGKKDSIEIPPPPPPDLGIRPKLTITPPSPAEDTRFRRIMRGGFTDMLRGKNKSSEELSPTL
ncbi:lisH domain and HEAT repeat-containing protein KIAA1468 homolog isoform X2 [Cynara cardunculus var. scolymus]|uniref:lisH domain and HEAT repeat-containing protein KIAA1468 homolog isoform X2 n=1 Tax=Cynara cardunculus var. scolymus TaxID=59895 RepID=UPI000D624941|nr:lisH domain and HEAT repeat-containing protein KIAA1468 homolog isoform X2 [Cynara cardunculus var. scolymus]